MAHGEFYHESPILREFYLTIPLRVISPLKIFSLPLYFSVKARVGSAMTIQSNPAKLDLYGWGRMLPTIGCADELHHLGDWYVAQVTVEAKSDLQYSK
jgi:hypothetical protein